MVSFSQFIPTAESMGSYVKVLLYGMIIVGVLTVAIIWIRNKIKYQYFSVIFKRREDDFEFDLPTSKTIFGKAGYFYRKGKTIFKTKYGLAPWHIVELSKLPDPQYMIGNTVFYLQLNKDNFVQARVKVDWQGNLSLEPVEDDLKYGAELDIREKSNILKVESPLLKWLGPIIMGFIFIAGLVAMYFVRKSCGG